MFKSNLSENAKKRINILKESNDGFYISEEDMKIRGFGDILGYNLHIVLYETLFMDSFGIKPHLVL